MNDKEIVTLEEARSLALSSAMIQTYPDTLKKETESLFLRIFWTRMHAECPDATSEDIEWARKQLRHLREDGLSEETMDSIADLIMQEFSALEEG